MTSRLLDTGQVVFSHFYWLRWSKIVNAPCIQILLRTDREGMVDDVIMHRTWHHLGIKYSRIVMDLQEHKTREKMFLPCKPYGLIAWFTSHQWHYFNDILEEFKIAQNTLNSSNFLVEKSSILKKWQTLAIMRKNFTPGDSLQNLESPGELTPLRSQRQKKSKTEARMRIKPISRHLDWTSLVNKGFFIWPERELFLAEPTHSVHVGNPKWAEFCPLR